MRGAARHFAAKAAVDSAKRKAEAKEARMRERREGRKKRRRAADTVKEGGGEGEDRPRKGQQRIPSLSKIDISSKSVGGAGGDQPRGRPSDGGDVLRIQGGQGAVLHVPGSPSLPPGGGGLHARSGSTEGPSGGPGVEITIDEEGAFPSSTVILVQQQHQQQEGEGQQQVIGGPNPAPGLQTVQMINLQGGFQGFLDPLLQGGLAKLLEVGARQVEAFSASGQGALTIELSASTSVGEAEVESEKDGSSPVLLEPASPMRVQEDEDVADEPVREASNVEGGEVRLGIDKKEGRNIPEENGAEGEEGSETEVRSAVWEEPPLGEGCGSRQANRRMEELQACTTTEVMNDEDAGSAGRLEKESVLIPGALSTNVDTEGARGGRDEQKVGELNAIGASERRRHTEEDTACKRRNKLSDTTDTESESAAPLQHPCDPSVEAPQQLSLPTGATTLTPLLETDCPNDSPIIARPAVIVGATLQAPPHGQFEGAAAPAPVTVLALPAAPADSQSETELDDMTFDPTDTGPLNFFFMDGEEVFPERLGLVRSNGTPALAFIHPQWEAHFAFPPARTITVDSIVGFIDEVFAGAVPRTAISAPTPPPPVGLLPTPLINRSFRKRWSAPEVSAATLKGSIAGRSNTKESFLDVEGREGGTKVAHEGQGWVDEGALNTGGCGSDKVETTLERGSRSETKSDSTWGLLDIGPGEVEGREKGSEDGKELHQFVPSPRVIMAGGSEEVALVPPGSPSLVVSSRNGPEDLASDRCPGGCERNGSSSSDSLARCGEGGSVEVARCIGRLLQLPGGPGVVPPLGDAVVLYTTPACGLCRRMALVFTEGFRSLELRKEEAVEDFERRRRERASRGEMAAEGETDEGEDRNGQLSGVRWPRLLEIDCSVNSCVHPQPRGVQVSKYPTVVLYPADEQQKPRVYGGAPTVKGLLAFALRGAARERATRDGGQISRTPAFPQQRHVTRKPFKSKVALVQRPKSKNVSEAAAEQQHSSGDVTPNANTQGVAAKSAQRGGQGGSQEADLQTSPFLPLPLAPSRPLGVVIPEGTTDDETCSVSEGDGKGTSAPLDGAHDKQAKRSGADHGRPQGDTLRVQKEGESSSKSNRGDSSGTGESSSVSRSNSASSRSSSISSSGSSKNRSSGSGRGTKDGRRPTSDSRLVVEVSDDSASRWCRVQPSAAAGVGSLLVATEFMGDATSFFGRAVVLMLSFSDQGPLGVVLNKPLAWSQVTGVRSSVQTELALAHLGQGGPVMAQPSIPFVVLTRRRGVKDFGEVLPGLFWGVNFEVVDAVIGMVLRKEARARDFWFFVGYSGWAHWQLLGEVATGSWYVANCSLEGIGWPSVGSEPRGKEEVWRSVLELMGGKYAGIATRTSRTKM
eukprot:TRINITY_DN19310_c0_g1_i1.p1 TRINITY_DN19310_c0_g1~~TRINITY_DN19310_c0_g1_i1.p1  ORF type:complete len:1505 (+),score=309.76 TRINITY_DN19310_c0_g1_i1:390-4517(+)